MDISVLRFANILYGRSLGGRQLSLDGHFLLLFPLLFSSFPLSLNIFRFLYLLCSLLFFPSSLSYLVSRSAHFSSFLPPLCLPLLTSLSSLFFSTSFPSLLPVSSVLSFILCSFLRFLPHSRVCQGKIINE